MATNSRPPMTAAPAITALAITQPATDSPARPNELPHRE
jgi:hypothetical protein